jgi:hypothetical protein
MRHSARRDSDQRAMRWGCLNRCFEDCFCICSEGLYRWIAAPGSGQNEVTAAVLSPHNKHPRSRHPRHRTPNVQSEGMEQPNARQLRSLRLSALARDNRAVAELNARISNSPDYLVEELMKRHGWPAHEAICAVQQLQEKAFQETADHSAA